MFCALKQVGLRLPKGFLIVQRKILNANKKLTNL